MLNRATGLGLLLLTVGGCGGGSTVGAPSELTGEGMGAGLHLRWKDNSTDEQEFVVEQRMGTAAFAEVGRVPFDTTQYMVESGQGGMEYQFRVRARLPTALSGPSNEVTWMPAQIIAISGDDAGTHQDPEPDGGADAGIEGDAGVTSPGVPSLVSASLVSHGTVSLSWHNPASTCATLNINRNKNAGAYGVAQNVSGQLTSAQDSPGHTSGTYCYTLTCKLNGLMSSASNEKCITQ